MKNLMLGIILNLILCLSVAADTSLWKVQLHKSVTYIGGTCHVLRKFDYPLPEEFVKAYEDSDVIVFETQLEELNSPKTQEMIIRQGFYNDDLSLDKVLSIQTYDLLRQYCEASGIPVFSLNKFKPSMVVLTLLGLELQKLGINQTGVDHYFHHKATMEGKKIEGLESVNKQIEFVLSMGEGSENDFIEHSIKDLKKTGQIINGLIAAWKQGDEDKLYKLYIAPLKKDYPNLYETLIAERNREWLSKIERYLQTPQNELILVGVGHLVGKDGIVDYLRRSGYSINKLDY
ncbi:MAG: TraB/GumN family protein [Deltaproteobacteria bacterium]|nr:TraB/GumN family protein [Deltaproteobacteria bacterium]MBW2619932.1 TraB/GumN family protein [Deltaproteobacteria bacterium]MBW2642798.1 TraB/GumN family protein [Deltaproteobacteria bacterium]